MTAMTRACSTDPSLAFSLHRRGSLCLFAMNHAFLADPSLIEELTVEQGEGLRNLVRDLTQQYGGKPADINWASVAGKVGMTKIYNSVYREMSGDGTHATISALNRHIKANADHEILHLVFEPSEEDLLPTLSSALASLLIATEALVA